MLHKKGKKFRIDGGDISERDVADAVAKALRFEFAHMQHAASTLMRWTGVNERTTKNWLSGSHGPSAANLLLLARRSPAIRRLIVRYAKMPPVLLAENLQGLRVSLIEAVAEIDATLGGDVAKEQPTSSSPTAPLDRASETSAQQRPPENPTVTARGGSRKSTSRDQGERH
jgi:hypothetical protein